MILKELNMGFHLVKSVCEKLRNLSLLPLLSKKKLVHQKKKIPSETVREVT